MGSAVYVLLNTHGPHDFKVQLGTKFVLMEAYSSCQSSYLLLLWDPQKSKGLQSYRIISLQCLLHYSHLPYTCTFIMLIIRLHGIIHRKALAKAMKIAKYCITITPLTGALLSEYPPLYTHPSIDESLCL